MQLVIRPILPNRADTPAAKWRSIERLIKGALKGPVKVLVVARMQARVANWQQRVGFQSRYSRVGGSVGDLTVFPAGAGRTRWIWVSGGTSARLIKAKRAKVLRFRPRYRGKTAPGNIYGLAAKRAGDFIYRPKVWHPGIKARNFEEHIVDEIEAPIQQIINKSVEGI